MAAARQDLDAGAGDAFADQAHRLGRRDGVLVARHHQGRAGDEVGIGGLRLRQRVAGTGVAVRALAHHQFAHHRHGRRLARAGLAPTSRPARCASAIACMPAIAFAARLLAARFQAGPRRVGRRQQRAEQRQAAHQLRCGRGQMERHDRAHGMGDHMRALDMQGRADPQHRLHEAIDRERTLDPCRPSGAGQIRPDGAMAHQRRHQRHPDVRGAAQPVNQQHVVARSVGLDGDPLDELRGHADPPLRRPSRRRARPANSGSLANWPSFMTASSALLVLQHGDVGHRIAVDQQQVGEVALLDLPELAAAHHDLAAVAGRRHQRLHRREAEILHEVFEVLGVGAVLDPGEAVVAARQDADAALVHLLQRLAGDLELAVIAHARRRPPA